MIGYHPIADDVHHVHGDAHERSAPPATIHNIPITIFRSVFSLNTTYARIAVNTPSKLSSKEAEDADIFSPTINKIGPAIPPKAVAPSSHSHL